MSQERGKIQAFRTVVDKSIEVPPADVVVTLQHPRPKECTCNDIMIKANPYGKMFNKGNHHVGNCPMFTTETLKWPGQEQLLVKEYEFKQLNSTEIDCGGCHFQDRRHDDIYSAYVGDVWVYVQNVGGSWGYTAWKGNNCLGGIRDWNATLSEMIIHAARYLNREM